MEGRRREERGVRKQEHFHGYLTLFCNSKTQDPASGSTNHQRNAQMPESESPPIPNVRIKIKKGLT